jgi:hypothetical protein
MKKSQILIWLALVGLIFTSCVKDEQFPAPPSVTNVTISPLAPEPADEVTVTAKVTDINGLTSVKLFYKINDGSYTSTTMSQVGTTTNYSATISAQEYGTLVSYYVEAENVINKKTVMPATAPATPATYLIGGPTVIHYWHFNGLTGQVTAPNTVNSDFTVTGLGVGTILFQGAYIDNIDPGTDINSKMGAIAGVGIRYRSPYGDIIITAPSTGYKNLDISFVLSRSGSGANTAEVLYSTNGTTWTTLQTFTGFAGEPTWTPFSIDLTSITAVNNSASLQFKVIPSGATGGNLRMDNLAIIAEKI